MMAFFLGTIIVIPSVLVVMVWRILRRRPVFPLARKSKIESPGIFYAGIGLFGLFALACLIKGLVVFGVVFLLFTLGNMAALAAFRRGWSE